MPVRGPKRPTLATIAASAGVSVATVSKVVNRRDDVAPDTRAQIEELLRQHDYLPPSVRRAHGATTTVELLIHGRFGAYTTQVLEGIVEAGIEAGTAIVVGRLDDQHVPGTTPHAWARGLLAAGRAGTIVVTGALSTAHVDALAQVGMPLVVIDPLNLPRADVTSVGSTNFAGGMTATRHLLGLGHREIAYIGGPPSSGCNQARLHGYRAALEGAGVAHRPELVINDEFHYEVGRVAGAKLIDLPDRPTAIVGGSDTIALGVMEAARARGLRVPDELSVTGFDDTELATMAAPQLTVIRQPLREMGHVALRTVLRMGAGETLDSHHVELATELVVRGTTAPPPFS
ncbi:LacI family DNA-binding transcriptional regulator [Pseudonocardia sp. TRM90224]|uniref:LacI family DNA-binding transcriptional regulator n=1 Tax=Pseudonocardia sp. TRM90224 TaxID=2812678 RepID=UPI001E2B70AB|nr:substrate-binding domain-containing protein [Pseudonocardia sp. TRM90224]